MTTPTTPPPAGDVAQIVTELRLWLGTERMSPAGSMLYQWQERLLDAAAAALERLANAEAARNAAICEMSEMARQAGEWRGTADGKDRAMRDLERERDAALKERDEAREQWHLYRDAAGLEAKHRDEAEDVLAAERAARERAEAALREIERDNQTEAQADNADYQRGWDDCAAEHAAAARAALQPQPQGGEDDE